MLSIPVYDENGKQTGTEQLDEALLGGEVNASLVKQAIVAFHANQRQGTVAQRSRGEVAGASQKLYRQKGTGRARAGTLRTPVRVGGGRAFPRKPRDYSQALPKKMKRQARNQAVLSRLQDERVCIVDGVQFDAPKTKRFAALLKAIKVDKGCVFTTAGVDPVLYKSGRNIPRIEIMPVAELSAYIVLSRPKLIFTRAAFEEFKQALSQPIGREAAGAAVSAEA